MRKFNLEEAINGKAFYLENGYRGVIKYCVDDFITQFKQPPNYPYVGYVLDDKGFLFIGHTAWNENGRSNEYQSFNATTMVDDTPPQDNKKETMKKFDLKAALNGEPVKLACGRKAYILYDLNRYPELLKHANRRPLNGLVMSDCKENDCYPANWLLDGKNSFDQDNIIGMWVEPKKQINIEDLPKPFKPKSGDGYYYINEYGVQFTRHYDEDDDSDVGMAENAQCYRTREDAQKWLGFMESMME